MSRIEHDEDFVKWMSAFESANQSLDEQIRERKLGVLVSLQTYMERLKSMKQSQHETRALMSRPWTPMEF